MSKQQLIHLVLPRLAKPLYRQLERYRNGELNDKQFTRSFQSLLQRQHAWLASRGVPDERAALVIHGAVLVLSAPGLRAEAEETGLPLEVIEYRAIKDAAADISQNYGTDERRAMDIIARIVARHGN